MPQICSNFSFVKLIPNSWGMQTLALNDEKASLLQSNDDYDHYKQSDILCTGPEPNRDVESLKFKLSSSVPNTGKQ